MSSRREFFGQVIGVLASGVAFRALEPRPYIPATNPLCEIERIIEVLKAPKFRQESCRLILRMMDDTLIEGPRMARIEQPAQNEFTFWAEPFQVSCSLVMKGFQFINWRNEFVNENKFVGGGGQRFCGPEEIRADWYANKKNEGKSPPLKWEGDTLKASYVVRLNT